MDNTNFSPEQIQQMISLLQQMLPTNTVENKPKVKQARSKKTSNVSKTKPRNNPIKTKKINMVSQHHENKFLEMSEMGMHKSDTDIDKKLNKFPPTPRSRPFQLVSVRCRVCGKAEEVHPKLVLDSVDRYKCNSCSKAQG